METLKKYEDFMGYDNLSYLYTDEDALLVINTYKVGTRFISMWHNKYNDPTEFQLDYCGVDKKYKIFDSNKNKVIEKIGNKEKIKKDVLLIYRNPIQKTITGLIEDFTEACLKLQNEEIYFEVLDFIDDNVTRKTIENIRKNYSFSQYDPNNECYKEFKDFFTENTYVYDTPTTTASVWKEFFYSYVMYRMRTFSISNKHSTFWCFPCYLLTKEYLEGYQNFYLFDLDDKEINLAKFLDKYKDVNLTHTDTVGYKYSNSFFKKWALETLDDKNLIRDIISRLQTEINVFRVLKGMKQNVTPEMI